MKNTSRCWCIQYGQPHCEIIYKMENHEGYYTTCILVGSSDPNGFLGEYPICKQHANTVSKRVQSYIRYKHHHGNIDWLICHSRGGGLNLWFLAPECDAIPKHHRGSQQQIAILMWCKLGSMNNFPPPPHKAVLDQVFFSTATGIYLWPLGDEPVPGSDVHIL